MHASAQFLEARDQLLRAREDWPRARREFRWPALTHFNWVRDYFDIVAAANQAPALRVVDDAGNDQTYSFARLADRACQVAAFLAAAGIEPGDRILLMLPNVVSLWEVMLAAIIEAEPAPDPTGHGTVVAQIIASAGVPMELCAAQVTDAEGRATPAAVAEALSWALAQRAQLIHLSLGLRHDRAVLAGAIARVITAGAIIVASTPARGVRTYPATYPGVIRATGDARCGREEISHLATPWAEFGACAVHWSPGGHAQRGTSIGAAYLTRFIVAHLPPSTEPAAVSRSLAERRAAESISSD